MAKVVWAVVVSGTIAVQACSGIDRPPYLDLYVSTGGTAGVRGSGGESGSGKSDGSYAAGFGMAPFDPSLVYLFGTLHEGSACDGAVSRLSTPKAYALGFGCNTVPWSTQLHGGKLRYVGPDHVFEFVPDLFSQLERASGDYPDAPEANDPIVPTPGCVDGTSPGVILAGPDGLFAYQCTIGRAWYDSADSAVLVGDDALGSVVHLGHGFALIEQVSSLDILQLKTGTEVMLAAIPATRTIAARASDTGFYIVTPTFDELDSPRLWHATPDGAAELLGVYPHSPAGTRPPSSTSAALTPDGSLYEITQTDEDLPADIVIRRTIAGDSEIVYTEADAWVKISMSYLVTGP